MVKAQLAEEKTRNTEANKELSALRARLGDVSINALLGTKAQISPTQL